MMQGYGPRPRFGKKVDEFQIEQIRQGYEDARARYLDAMKTGNQEVATKAIKDLDFYKNQFDYMQVPTQAKAESFEPTKSGATRMRANASDYMFTELTPEQRTAYGPGSSQIGDVFGGSMQRGEQLKNVENILRTGGRKALEEYLREQRISGGGFV